MSDFWSAPATVGVGYPLAVLAIGYGASRLPKVGPPITRGLKRISKPLRWVASLRVTTATQQARAREEVAALKKAAQRPSTKKTAQQMTYEAQVEQAEALRRTTDQYQADIAAGWAKAKEYKAEVDRLQDQLDQARSAAHDGLRMDAGGKPAGLGRGIAALLDVGAQERSEYVPDPHWRIFEDLGVEDVWFIGSTIAESRAKRVRISAPRSYFDLLEGGYWAELRGGFTGEHRSFKGSVTDWGRSHRLTFDVTWLDAEGNERQEEVPALQRPDKTG